MSTVGKITRQNDGINEELFGYISTLEISLSFMLQKIKDKHSDRSPTYEIVAKTDGGYGASVGSAWENTAKYGSYAGTKFLSLVFDDPSFPSALNVAAYVNPQNLNEWNIVWRRERTDGQGKKQPSPSFTSVGAIS